MDEAAILVNDDINEEVMDWGANDDPPEEEKKAKLTLRVFRFGTGWDYLVICLGILMNLGTGVAMPVFMSTFGHLTDTLSGQPSDKSFTDVVLEMVYLGIFMFGSGWVGAACFELTAEKQMRAIKAGYLQSVMRQEIGWFDTYDSGILSSKLNQNCIDIRDALGMKLGQIFMCVGMFITGYTLGMVNGWKMALVLTAPMPLIALCGFFLMKWLGEAGTGSQKFYGKAGSVVEETLMSIRTVVAFGLEDSAIERYSVQLAKVCGEGVKGAYYKAGGLAATLGILFLTYALGFWYGAKLVADDLDKYGADCMSIVDLCFTGGDAMAVFFEVIIAAFALGQAGPSISAFAKASAAVVNVFEILDRQSAIDPYSKEGIMADVDGDIEFTNVQFAYPARKDNDIFKRLNLKIDKGKTVALVGPSGCGKSTIVQMIERFYDPTGGTMVINGHDCKEYNIQHYRSQIAIVSQEPRLFAKTVAENIGYGLVGASQEQIEDAAKKANAHDFIMKFPDGYRTFVGEGGGQLSGGQKQRIAIARAILRQPKILILDEATSALDNESEKIVQMTLDKLIAETSRTTIIIAHRLSTIRNADRILVLDRVNNEGAEVIEQGTHDELMLMEQGIYHALVVSQTLIKPGDPDYGVKPALANQMSLEIAEQFIDELPERSQTLVRMSSKYSKTGSKLRIGRSKNSKNSKTSKNPKTMSKKEKQALEFPPPKMWDVLQLMKPDWWMLAVGFCGAVLNGSIFPCFGVVFSYFVSVFYLPTSEQIMDKAAFWSEIFIAIAAAVATANLLQMTFIEKAGQKLAVKLRKDLFGQILFQELAFFDEPRHSTGTLSEMLSADIMLVKGWIGDNIGLMVQNITSFIEAVILSFLASPQLGGVALASFCLLIPLTFLEAKMMTGNGTSSLDEDDVETSGYIMNETITNIRMVAAYGLQDSMSKAYDKIVDRDYRKGFRHSFLGGFLWGLSQGAQMWVQSLCMWYGGTLVQQGKIDVQRMMQAIMALMMAAMGAGQSMIFMTDVQKAKNAAGRVWGILDRPPRIDARSPDGDMLQDCQGDIELDHVRFSYPLRPEVPIYKDISFSIPRGKTVALVGSSGCGKSTVVQLLERFYDVDAGGAGSRLDVGDSQQKVGDSPRKRAMQGGRVMLDHNNVKDVNVRALRKNIGLVSQEPSLFAASIKQNIRMGRPGASEEEIETAARMSNAHNFISRLPEGYNTEVGKFGGRMSGGQKQRIAIARAIIRDPKILVLDEATSALDAESERIVQDALDKLVAHSARTTIVIAHRLSTVKNADKIVVFVNDDNDGSQIVEQGTHDELMTHTHGTYRGLVRLAEGR